MTLFDRTEYLDRIRETKAQMEQIGADVLLIVNPGNMYYLTGYGGDSAYVPQMVVLSLAEEEPWIILRMMDSACALTTVFMRDNKIIGYPESYIGRHDRNGFDFIVEKIKEWNLGSLRIGTEKSDRYFCAIAWDKLQTGLPNARFIDATDLVTRVRLIKSSTEIEFIRQAAAIADTAMKTAVDAINVGVRECDAAAELHAALCRGTASFGGELPLVSSVSMPSGANTAAPHLSWTDKLYQQNTPINIELGGVRYRYTAALSRSIYLGKPPQILHDLHAVTLASMEEVFSRAKPGMLCQDVARIFGAEIGKHGFKKESRCGYSIGIDWLETSASFQEGDLTELTPNMTFHLMLGMWQQGIGYVLSETFRVTESGTESFARLPRELFVKN